MTDTFGEDPYDERDDRPLRKDLDQSDVDRDASDMRDAYLERLSEDLDGADLVVVIDILAEDQGVDFARALHSQVVADIIRATQSNPSEALTNLEEIARVLNA